jgi:multidrug efflux pump
VKLPNYFIDRPIFASVLSVLIILLGALAAFKLPVSEYPQVVPPSIAINATYPGASPETIAATVAGPLEQQMTGLDGLLYMSSQSTPDGGMGLTLTFAIGTDLDKVLVDVQNRVQVATPRLPDEVRRLGVVAQKATRDILMVVNLNAKPEAMDSLALANFARLVVRDQLLRIQGVRDASVFGGGEYAMRIWLDPDRMAARGLAPSDVVNAIRTQNVQVAAGSLAKPPTGTDASPFELTITTQGRLTEISQFEDIIVRRGDGGQLVRVKDVGQVELGANTYGIRSMLDNTPAVGIPIFQAPGSNALTVSDEVRATMERLSGSFPAGVAYDIVYDPTQFIRTSIHEVLWTLGEAILLVVFVVILFLQSWRASVITLVAVPVSIIGTFAVMLPFGFSINALSLFGLVLAIGIVVDDAIVVVENVERNLRNGLNPRAATRQAMKEVSGPIIATALVLAAVFIPTAFVSGLTGRFYQQFALTIAISTVISAINSLTLSPALAALLLKPHKPGEKPGGPLLGWFFVPFNRMFDAAASGYVATTRRILRMSAIALLLYGGLLLLTGGLFYKTPTDFVPKQDKGFLIAFAKLPDGASLDRTEAVIRRMGEIAKATPGVDKVVQLAGISLGFTAQSNSGIMFVRLKPYAERERAGLTAEKVSGMLSGQFMQQPEAFALAVSLPPIIGLGSTGGFKLYVEDRGGAGMDATWNAVQEVLNETRKDPRLGRCYTLSSMSVPRIRVDVDREKVVSQGVRLTEIYDALQGYFGAIYVNDFNRFGRTWQVSISAEAEHRLSPGDLERVRVRNGKGDMVPLASFITVVETAGPDKAVQYNTYPAIDISGEPGPGFTGDDAQAAINEIMARTLPTGMKHEFTELTYQQIIAGNSAVYIFPICVLLVFLVLAAFYESLVLPMAIILIVPMCLLSALVGVNLMDRDNNIMTQIGLIVLVGLACKNAILIVEFAREEELTRGLSPFEAALEACRLRLRPILMTSIAFILGVLPLVLAHGAGAELRSATGTAVFFGMIGVTIFGLNFTPVFYVVLRAIFRGPLHNAGLEHAAHEADEDAKPLCPPTAPADAGASDGHAPR